MTDNDHWHRPAGCSDSACVEWRRWTYGSVSIRSSVQPAEIVTLSPAEWAAFVVAVGKGEVGG
jgi:hypothetical protein